jgi:hypothetical protein
VFFIAKPPNQWLMPYVGNAVPVGTPSEFLALSTTAFVVFGPPPASATFVAPGLIAPPLLDDMDARALVAFVAV